MTCGARSGTKKVAGGDGDGSGAGEVEGVEDAE